MFHGESVPMTNHFLLVASSSSFSRRSSFSLAGIVFVSYTGSLLLRLVPSLFFFSSFFVFTPRRFLACRNRLMCFAASLLLGAISSCFFFFIFTANLCLAGPNSLRCFTARLVLGKFLFFSLCHFGNIYFPAESSSSPLFYDDIFIVHFSSFVIFFIFTPRLVLASRNRLRVSTANVFL